MEKENIEELKGSKCVESNGMSRVQDEWNGERIQITTAERFFGPSLSIRETARLARLLLWAAFGWWKEEFDTVKVKSTEWVDEDSKRCGRGKRNKKV